MYSTIGKAAEAYMSVKVASLRMSTGHVLSGFSGASVGGAQSVLGLTDEEGELVDSRIERALAAHRKSGKPLKLDVKEVFKGVYDF